VRFAARVLVVCLAVSGCGQREVRIGDPCSPGDGYAPYAETPGRWLACSGPPGCDGPAEGWFWGHSESESGVHDARVWCGCDGNSGSPPVERRDDAIGTPTVRWQWVGGCAPDCSLVSWSRDRWVYRGLWGPVAPECTECDLVRFDDDGTCTHPLHAPPPHCCHCDGAALDDDGICVGGDYGSPVSPACCE